MTAIGKEQRKPKGVSPRLSTRRCGARIGTRSEPAAWPAATEVSTRDWVMWRALLITCGQGEGCFRMEVRKAMSGSLTAGFGKCDSLMALRVVISVAFESGRKNPDGNKLRKPVRGARGSEAAGRQGVGVGCSAGEDGTEHSSCELPAGERADPEHVWEGRTWRLWEHLTCVRESESGLLCGTAILGLYSKFYI